MFKKNYSKIVYGYLAVIIFFGNINFVSANATTTPGNIFSNTASFDQYCLNIDKNLVKGARGTLISALQRFLKSEGHFPNNEEVSGYYGDITVRAITDFQVANGLIKTSTQIGAGTVGPITRAKIREISCKKLSESQQALNATTTVSTASTTEGLFNSKTKKNTIVTIKPPKVALDFYERYVNEEQGKSILRYNLVATPKELASYLEGVILCDPSALTLVSKDIKKCGQTFIFDPIKNGKKSFSISFQNSSRSDQPVTFAVEVFNTLRESIGMAEVFSEVPALKPTIKLDVNNRSVNQAISGSSQGKKCTYAEQLDFIRYVMTPFKPTNEVSLPICYPGELLCNKTNPPTFCKITDGPTSDDLCLKSQVFFEGRCVPRQ
jgi:peptidoglycan hydrolase-like protein with peptidoglycan-binding domain